MPRVLGLFTSGLDSDVETCSSVLLHSIVLTVAALSFNNARLIHIDLLKFLDIPSKPYTFPSKLFLFNILRISHQNNAALFQRFNYLAVFVSWSWFLAQG